MFLSVVKFHLVLIIHSLLMPPSKHYRTSSFKQVVPVSYYLFQCQFNTLQKRRSFLPSSSFIWFVLHVFVIMFLSSMTRNLAMLKRFLFHILLKTHILNIFKLYFIMEVSIKTPIKIKEILTNKTCSK